MIGDKFLKVKDQILDAYNSLHEDLKFSDDMLFFITNSSSKAFDFVVFEIQE